MHPIERLRYVARSSGADERVLVRETAGALRGLQLEPAGLVTACRRIVERHPASGPLWWMCSQVLTASEPFRTASLLADTIEDDPTPRALSHAIPDDAIVTVIGWPDLVADALVRRGDIRVLVVDTDGNGGGLCRQLQRADVDVHEVPAGAIATAAASSDLVLVEPTAVSTSEALGPMGSRALASAAYCAEVPVWLVAGVGRRLPQQTWSFLAERVAERGISWFNDHETFPVGLATHVVDAGGVTELTADTAPSLLAAECPVAHELLRRSPI